MKRIGEFTVRDYKWLNQSNFIIELQSEEELPVILPGNFAEIEVPGNKNVFLRRPFSILDVNYQNKTLSFYVKIVGEGTKRLGQLNPGEKTSIIYPLGNSFTAYKNKKALIVGGGSGIAPFVLLGKKLNQFENDVTFLVGGRTSKEVYLTEVFSLFGKVEVTTEDGSRGIKGLVTDHPVLNEDPEFDIIYTCGPDPMMKAVAKIAGKHNIPCEASLENTMACGFGACLCCITHTKDGNKCVCTAGPVFDTKYLEWQI